MSPVLRLHAPARRRGVALSGALAVAALATPIPAWAGERIAQAIQAKGEIPEERLLDVAIDVLEPGLGQHDPATLAKRGVRPSVRKSEARYIAVRLRDTLQSTGQWGAVRVVPGGSDWADLNLAGRIMVSNGKDLTLQVEAWDATGREWLDKRYDQEADPSAYAKERVDDADPFQRLYNRIANDLVSRRDRRKTRDLVESRQVARLRFAAGLAPDPYAAYLKPRKAGYRIERLPAEDDPMLRRIGQIRDRDQMFVDTLNEYYADFYARMDKAYDDWRGYSYQEQVAYDKLHKSSLLKKLLGTAAILGGILVDDIPPDMEEVLVIGGIAAIQSGFKDSEESKMHKVALDELAESFEGDVTPLLVDLDGKTVELTGSTESQFVQWRELLRQIASAEAALPTDINVLPAPPWGIR